MRGSVFETFLGRAKPKDREEREAHAYDQAERTPAHVLRLIHRRAHLFIRSCMATSEPVVRGSAADGYKRAASTARRAQHSRAISKAFTPSIPLVRAGAHVGESFLNRPSSIFASLISPADPAALYPRTRLSTRHARENRAGRPLRRAVPRSSGRARARPAIPGGTRCCFALAVHGLRIGELGQVQDLAGAVALVGARQ
jgi:hypothetical protein